MSATQTGDPDDTGSIDLRFDTTTGEVCSTLTTSNIAAPAAAHIHSGVAGSTGPIVVTLSTTTGCSNNDPALVSSIVDAPADFYVNVHNADYPNGAIRSQVAATTDSSIQSTRFDLLPTGDPDGSGSVDLVFDAAANEVCFDLTVVTDETVNAAHIHTGADGVQGPVLIGLPIGDTGLRGCTSTSEANVDAIIANPTGFYVNVHNVDYPNGAIRSQLAAVTAAMTTGFDVALAPSGDTDGSGTAMLEIDAATGRVCFELATSNTGTVTVAHVHSGGIGQDGPIVVDFDVPTNGLSGCVFVDAAVTTGIVADPGAFYVNVHTAEYPSGAARAQVNAAPTAATTTTSTTIARRLPDTGTDNGAMALIAAAMLGLGGTLVGITRRRNCAT